MQECRAGGVGNQNAPLQVYMANRPAFELAGEPGAATAIDVQVINQINAACGNGWRKVFNVYAKWVFSLLEGLECHSRCDSWQTYRDTALLTAEGATVLWFSAPVSFNPDSLNIVMGRTYAGHLGLTDTLDWIAADFAICLRRNLIVTPYFDYRQLTNEKIGFLNYLIRHHLMKDVTAEWRCQWLELLRSAD